MRGIKRVIEKSDEKRGDVLVRKIILFLPEDKRLVRALPGKITVAVCVLPRERNMTEKSVVMLGLISFMDNERVCV